MPVITQYLDKEARRKLQEVGHNCAARLDLDPLDYHFEAYTHKALPEIGALSVHKYIDVRVTQLSTGRTYTASGHKNRGQNAGAAIKGLAFKLKEEAIQAQLEKQRAQAEADRKRPVELLALTAEMHACNARVAGMTANNLAGEGLWSEDHFENEAHELSRIADAMRALT